jgi:hypothetical protein
VVPDFDRDEPDFARVDPDFARDELDFARDELDFARVPLRAELDRDLLDDEPERDRELLEDDRRREALDPFDELLDRLDDARRRPPDEPLRRSAAGISSRATAFASCAICFSRNLAIRSSSRRMPFASFTVSLSPTVSASASMPA